MNREGCAGKRLWSNLSDIIGGLAIKLKTVKIVQTLNDHG
jgi:hypothetical protein